MTYRILPREEWERLAPIMERQGKPLPNPENANAAVAEKDGEIVGVGFIQITLHMEPLVIEDAYVNFITLKDLLESRLPNKGVSYYCYTQNDKSARIAQLCGFSYLGEFWGKEIVNGIPQP